MITTPQTRQSQGEASARGNAKKQKRQQKLDDALREALSMHDGSEARWSPLMERGAYDAEIWHALLKEFGQGGSSQTEDGVQFAYLGGNPSAVPKFWIDSGTHYSTQKPTVSGAALVRRVRELLSIPQPASYVDTAGPGAATGEASPEASPEAASGAKAAREPEGPAGHEFKPTTSRDGRCVVCNKDSNTPAHREWKAQQREREKVGGPKRDAQFWREKAAAMTRIIADKLRPYDLPGKKTLRKIEEYESRIRAGLDSQQWQATLINVADLVQEGKLPAILYGLTNEYQVRTLINWNPATFDPSNMGPTIKTKADMLAAQEALKPFVPELHEDPNLDPRDGTEWARALSVGTDDAAGDRGCGGPCEHTDEEHAAFDLGVKDGERDVDMHAFPYDEGPLREAWATGHSVGALNRRASTTAAPGDGVLVTDEDSVYADDDPRKLIEATEREQRGRWDTVLDLERQIETAKNVKKPSRKRLKELDAQLKESRETYFASWIELSDAVGTSLTKQARARVEMPVNLPEILAASGDAEAQGPAVFTADIEVELSDCDYKQKSRELAFKREEIEKLQAEKKKTVEGYTARIGALEEECNGLYGEIRSGRATLELKVCEVRDYERRVVETVRVDTGTVAKSRPMQPRELQRKLPTL